MNRLPRLIAEFKEKHPDVNFSLEILKCSEFYSKLADNRLDIAFTIGYLKKEQDINYTAEREKKICVLSSPKHPLAGMKKLNARDFNRIPLIMAESAAYYRQNFLRELEANGTEVNIMIETESIQTIKNLSGCTKRFIEFSVRETEKSERQQPVMAFRDRSKSGDKSRIHCSS